MSEQSDVAKVSESNVGPTLSLPSFKNCELEQLTNQNDHTSTKQEYVTPYEYDSRNTKQVYSTPSENEENVILQSRDSFNYKSNDETEQSNEYIAQTRNGSQTEDLTSSTVSIGGDYQSNQNVTEEIFEVPQLKILCIKVKAQTCPKSSNDNPTPKSSKTFLCHNGKDNTVEVALPTHNKTAYNYEDPGKTDLVFKRCPNESNEDTLPEDVSNNTSISCIVDQNQSENYPQSKEAASTTKTVENDCDTSVRTDNCKSEPYSETEKDVLAKNVHRENLEVERVSPARSEDDVPTSLTSSLCRCQNYRKRQYGQDYFEDSIRLNESFSSAFSYQVSN